MDPPVSPHSADEETPVLPDQIPKYQRSLRSLHLLTTKFVRILQEAKGGELDLREAVRILNVSQKRRIYDITNVLEGVGLVMKMSKSMIKWMGTLRSENGYDLEERRIELKSELEDLEQKELILDQQKLWVEQSIRNTKEDSTLTYVNHEDICSCFTGHTLLVVRAPPGTQLDVPIPKAVQDSPTKYQIHLKSVKGPIDVVLLNKHSVSSVPVVLPVPPPEEILQRAQLAMSASNEKESRTEPRLASANTKHFTECKRTAVEDMMPRQSSSCINAEPNRTDESRYLSKELQELMDPLKEKMTRDLLTQLLASEVFSPLLHLSTPPSDHDYSCNVDDSEGVCDLPLTVLNV
ncbi:transcription factor E2F5-like [Amphiprion ocellaris]|uniref:transcription factor E2F5-like n=1 Tax=Amphiprion ocellaris TaxID=80972 RepID=UPI0024111CE6|nr:transcription factor E2F5-like [Amphiprion ocellaris]